VNKKSHTSHATILFMKAYLINLPHRTDRLDFFNKNTRPALEKIGFEIEVFEAVDGSTLTDNVWERGVYGCFASHVSVYRKALSEGIDTFAVFEDDVSLTGIDLEAAQKLIQNLPKRWSLLYLSGGAPGGVFINRLYQDIFSGKLLDKALEVFSKNQKSPKKNPRWSRAVAACTTTAGMILSAQFAQRFLNKFTANGSLTHTEGAHHIDWVLIKYAMYRPYIMVYRMDPGLLTQNIALDSDISWYPEVQDNEHDFEALISLVQENKEWEIIPSRGGFGEAFTLYAMYKFFDTHKINLTDFDTSSETPLVLSGGSDPYRTCDYLREQLDRVEKKNRNIIIFPITIPQDHSLYTTCARFPNLTVVARDKKTHERCLEKGILSDLSHDITLSLRDLPCKNSNTKNRSLLSLEQKSRGPQREVPEITFEGDYSFDGEYDLSHGVKGSVKTHSDTEWRRENVESFVVEVLEDLCSYGSIVTNNLHIGVAGSLLGKKVSYIHTRTAHAAVFDHSLQGFYPFVQMRW